MFLFNLMCRPQVSMFDLHAEISSFSSINLCCLKQKLLQRVKSKLHIHGGFLGFFNFRFNKPTFMLLEYLDMELLESIIQIINNIVRFEILKVVAETKDDDKKQLVFLPCTQVGNETDLNFFIELLGLNDKYPKRITRNKADDVFKKFLVLLDEACIKMAQRIYSKSCLSLNAIYTNLF